MHQLVELRYFEASLIGDHRPRQATANDNADSPDKGDIDVAEVFSQKCNHKKAYRWRTIKKVPKNGTFFTITVDFFPPLLRHHRLTHGLQLFQVRRSTSALILDGDGKGLRFLRILHL
jgi:hypothetical protein